MGTLVARVDSLRQPMAELTEKYPCGRVRIDLNGKPVDSSHQGEFRYGGGALDSYLKKILRKRFPVAEHNGVRFMTFHSKTNTRGGRKPEENVDYA